MRLFHRDLGGSGTPILILHGLFASSKNWVSAGRSLARWGHVLALDLRNHGDSPHAPSHSLADLVSDLEEWRAGHPEGDPVLVGHSMGGLAAMAYALRHPRGVRALVVVDIAPRYYGRSYERELAALRLDLSGCRSRRQVDRALEPLIPDARLRGFFQMSVERAGTGYRFKLNPTALESSALLRGQGFELLEGLYSGPALFVAGGASGYILPEDRPLIRRRFPAARIETLAGADHWLHHTAAGPFLARVDGFFAQL